MQHTWALGAGDVEMNHIESLLEQAGQNIVYAFTGRGRVRASEAYNDDIFFYTRKVHSTRGEQVDPQTIDYLVECGNLGYTHFKIIDHHRIGDPGHAVKPSNFLPGSSIGQVIERLSVINDGRDLPMEFATPSTDQFENAPMHRCFFLDGAWWIQNNHFEIAEIPEHYQYIAAGDHCLTAAYQGRCPGIDPEKMYEHRVFHSSLFEQRTKEQIKEMHFSTYQWLNKIKSDKVDDELFREHNVLDLTQTDTRPYITEIAAIMGVGLLLRGKTRSRKEKLVLIGEISPTFIHQWMGEQEQKGRSVYGSLARGYAGAYLKEGEKVHESGA